MFSELKELLTMVQGLPNMVLWVLGGFLVYKLAIAGSIWSTVRLAIVKTHDYYNNKKARPIYTKFELGRYFITCDSTPDEFMAAIRKIRNAKTSIETDYIHDGDVRWLHEAIDEKKAREVKK